MPPKPSKYQTALHALLSEAERTKRPLTPEEIAEKTGYKADSVRTNLSEGHWARYLVQVRPGFYQAKGLSDTSLQAFCRSISQSQRVRNSPYACDNPVASALLRKSRENLILALELYNRPSLENRMDGFVVLFCIAWEQLLKAQIIEIHGSEEAIFRKVQEGRPRETLSLRECIDRLSSKLSINVRRNLERIKDLRDKAVHLLMPEVQAVVSRLFQSGVQNYSSHFRDFAGAPMLPEQPVGLLTLIGDFTHPNNEILRESYGPILGADVLDLCTRLEDEIEKINDPDFALPIRYRLVFTQDAASADITLSKATEAATHAVIIEKPVSHKRSHPHRHFEATELINSRLRSALGADEFQRRIHLDGRKLPAGSHRFTTADFDACVCLLKWKGIENAYHHQVLDSPPTHTYSDQALEEIVEKITKDPTFLSRARQSYRKQTQRKSTASSTEPVPRNSHAERNLSGKGKRH